MWSSSSWITTKLKICICRTPLMLIRHVTLIILIWHKYCIYYIYIHSVSVFTLFDIISWLISSPQYYLLTKKGSGSVWACEGLVYLVPNIRKAKTKRRPRRRSYYSAVEQSEWGKERKDHEDVLGRTAKQGGKPLFKISAHIRSNDRPIQSTHSCYANDIRNAFRFVNAVGIEYTEK